MKKFLIALMLALCSVASAQTTITIGDSKVESGGDNGNGNLLLAQSASLPQSATLQSISFYVSGASGSLLLGVYDSSGPGGSPGVLLTSASSFTPVAGWNTRSLTPVTVPAGTYWLAYLPSSDNLSFRKQNSSGSCYLYGLPFSGGLPSTFSSSASSCTPTTWSFYATATTVGPSTMHYSVQYTLSGLDLRKYPLFNVTDGTTTGTPVFMSTTTFVVWLGQFSTLALCQAYVPPTNPSFVFTYNDPTSGSPISISFVSGNNMTATNNGCADRNFQ